MIRRPRLHSIATSNSGLTLIPVLASILLLSIFMGLLVQRQVRGQLAWKMEVRKSIARNMARSERDRLMQLKVSGQKIPSGNRVIRPSQNSFLAEPASILVEATKSPSNGHKITVQIPSDSTSNFVREALELP
ncbi:MAG: hypothetical protein DWI24_06370 [Planctomycetota bacterium]|nr:MAG: hypothetical protein DWI24_06370 [Planctomycetota bacterium]